MSIEKLKRLICAVAIAAGVINLQAGTTARWIGEDPEPDWDRTAKNLIGRKVDKAILPKNTVRFRRVFSLPSGEILRAEARACGLGLYELWVN